MFKSNILNRIEKSRIDFFIIALSNTILLRESENYIYNIMNCIILFLNFLEIRAINDDNTYVI